MQKKRRILICGGRDFNNQELFDYAIEQVSPWLHDYFVVIQGGARGADRMAKQWAKRFGYPMIEMEAPWDTLGKKAGIVRNAWMLEFTMPDLVIAFPGGTGTRNMKDIARAAGIDVYPVSIIQVPGLT